MILKFLFTFSAGFDQNPSTSVKIYSDNNVASFENPMNNNEDDDALNLPSYAHALEIEKLSGCVPIRQNYSRSKPNSDHRNSFDDLNINSNNNDTNRNYNDNNRVENKQTKKAHSHNFQSADNDTKEELSLHYLHVHSSFLFFLFCFIYFIFSCKQSFLV